MNKKTSRSSPNDNLKDASTERQNKRFNDSYTKLVNKIAEGAYRKVKPYLMQSTSLQAELQTLLTISRVRARQIFLLPGFISLQKTATTTTLQQQSVSLSSWFRQHLHWFLSQGPMQWKMRRASSNGQFRKNCNWT